MPPSLSSFRHSDEQIAAYDAESTAHGATGIGARAPAPPCQLVDLAELHPQQSEIQI